MSERTLWADVANVAIMEHAKRISAAKEGKRETYLVSIGPIAVMPYDDEIDIARRYFSSPDWAEVAACAGLSVTPDQVMARVMLGYRALRKIQDRESRPQARLVEREV